VCIGLLGARQNTTAHFSRITQNPTHIEHMNPLR